MSRKGVAAKVRFSPDPKYRDKVISKLINKIMWDGKKNVAEKIVYGALDIIEKKKGDEALKIFRDSLESIKPVLEVRSRRVGGANYQVPVEVRPERRLSLGLRWLVDSARARGEKTMCERLAGEIIDALESRGGAIKKRDEVHRMAEANRAFAHYRW
jgi:small subunit ribosomal protein S7